MCGAATLGPGFHPALPSLAGACLVGDHREVEILARGTIQRFGKELSWPSPSQDTWGPIPYSGTWRLQRGPWTVPEPPSCSRACRMDAAGSPRKQTLSHRAVPTAALASWCPGQGRLPGDLLSGNQRSFGAAPAASPGSREVLLSAQHLQLGPAVSPLTIPVRFAWLSASGATRSRRQRCAGESRGGGFELGEGSRGQAGLRDPQLHAGTLLAEGSGCRSCCTPETLVVCGMGLVLRSLCPGVTAGFPVLLRASSSVGSVSRSWPAHRDCLLSGGTSSLPFSPPFAWQAAPSNNRPRQPGAVGEAGAARHPGTGPPPHGGAPTVGSGGKKGMLLSLGPPHRVFGDKRCVQDVSHKGCPLSPSPLHPL